ncbi:thioesterase domain-containing protein [Streptomyces sp. NPDC006602]|uniref:thioesterase domain-containing protein n=1 Tax=Streptomyces sp. NPDC006602 TaxID=3364751 RepID=UPI0036929C28
MIKLDTADAEAQHTLWACQEIEEALCEIWSEHLGREVLPYDDFFDLGGDSVAMIDVVLAARQRGIQVRSSVALRNPVPARLAERLTVHGDARSRFGPLQASPENTKAFTDADSGACGANEYPSVIVDGGGAEPLYVVHSEDHVQVEQEAVAAWAGGVRPAKGFALPEHPVALGTGIADLAEGFLTTLRRERPEGPYLLAGFGTGAVVAFEMARRLRENSHSVPVLALIRPRPMRQAAEPPPVFDELLRQRHDELARRFGLTGDEDLADIHTRMRRAGWYGDALRPAALPRLQHAWAHLAMALGSYTLTHYAGPALLVLDREDIPLAQLSWGRFLHDPQNVCVDYGLESPKGVIGDLEVARTMREVLSP